MRRGGYNTFNLRIKIISIAIPLIIAILFTIKIPNSTPLTFLPPIYACINALTAILLVIALKAIKSGMRNLHENLMKTCIGLSLIFLVMYITYHMTSTSTIYGDLDKNGERSVDEKINIGYKLYLYLTILFSHIILSIALIPMVLISYVRAIQAQFKHHKKIAKITFPIWLYVTLTGVIVYLMISPYY